ncbi:hypothetical protein FACS189432_04020 [Bacteroidia bacterium]|nr:hypothetical protein FACS189426_10960 [Bacteroidia bacterium]GHT27447.1 hypothetical protein FACS189432_04020 [Bacteroidia bacterium]
MLAWLVFPSIPLHAQFFYEEPGRTPMGIFHLYQSASYTGGSNDPAGDGWVRLTPNQPDRLGYVLLDRVFPGTQGVCVEFDYKVYGGNYDEADGFSVFLIDATAGAFTHGLAAGGGLGFTNNRRYTTSTGISIPAKTGARPTYLGVGIDEYGNFSNPRTLGTGVTGGPGLTPHSIAIRAGDGDSYRYLVGTGTRLNGTPLYPTMISHSSSLAAGRPNDATFYRRLRVNLEPSRNGVEVTVFLKTSLSAPDYTEILSYTYTQPRPNQMRVGFAATTGQKIANHEVRDIIIRTPGLLQVFKQIPDCITKDDAPITTIIACNTTTQNGIVVKDTLPAGYVVNPGFPTITNGTVVGGTFPTPITLPDGRKVYNYTVNAPANTIVRVRYNGVFNPVPTGGGFTTSAGITPPPSFSAPNSQLTAYATMTRSINGITRITPTGENVTYVPGTPPGNFEVSAAPGATLEWHTSMDNVNWHSGNNTTTSYTPPANLFIGDQAVYVRCTAEWTAGCTDEVIWKCTVPQNPGDCPLVFSPLYVPNVDYVGGTSQEVTASSCCTTSGVLYQYLVPTGFGDQYATVSPASSADGKFTVTFAPNPTGEERMAYVIVTGPATRPGDPCFKTGVYTFYQDGKWLQNDYATVFANTTGNPIDVLVNDRLPASCDDTATPEPVAYYAQHGTAAVVNKAVVYTPNPGFTGRDSLMYKVTCDGSADTAVVYITVVDYPDNVVNATCVVDLRPKYEWKIKDVPTLSTDNYNTLQSVFAADLDGDGKPEMITTNVNSSGYTDRLYILNSNAGVIKDFPISQTLSTALPIGAVGKVKTGAGAGDNRVLIFTTSVITRRLYAYNTDGTLFWTLPNGASSDDYGTGDYVATVSLADLDGDGWSELIVGNRVFAAESGRLLLDLTGSSAISHGEDDSTGPLGTTGTTGLYQSSVGEVLPGSGRQQVCSGNAVYDVKIDRAGVSSYTVQTITPVIYNGDTIPIASRTNGCTQLVDLDLDGNLDVVVSTVDRATTTCYLYVWSPAKNRVIASAKIPGVYKKGIPGIGDIDGDGFLDIVFMYGSGQEHQNFLPADKIIALKFNPFAQDRQLQKFWDMIHNSKSGTMTMTLFDFKRDGISELVLRDENDLRIINGSLRSHVTGNDTTVVYDLAKYPCAAYTGFEYPTVVDIDNDGRAEILIVGPAVGSIDKTGPVRIFKAGEGTAWAPARNVWNQYAYNAVNVNRDLSIPRYPLSPATAFPGGTQPYNAFLQQQTILNKGGGSLWLTPDAHPAGSPTFSYDAAGDSLSIHLNITNTGDAALQAPFYIAMYKNIVSTPNNLTVDSVLTTLNVGDNIAKTIVIRNVSTRLTSPDSIIIRLNDDGKGLYLQPECDTVNNRFAVTLGLFRVSKSLPECIQPTNAPASIQTKIANSLGGGPGSIGAQTGIAVSDTIPAGFTVTGNPVSVPSGATTFITPIDTLPDGRQVYHYTVNIGVDEEVTVTYNGDFANQDSTQNITTSARINPTSFNLPSGIIILPGDLYATRTDSVKRIILVTPDTKVVRYSVGTPETLTVKSDSRATFKWSYSTDNGTTWAPATGAPTNSYTPPAALFDIDQIILVKCEAEWSTGCSDEVIYTLTASRGLIIPVNPHIRVFVK